LYNDRRVVFDTNLLRLMLIAESSMAVQRFRPLLQVADTCYYKIEMKLK
jgi:hypothetical protein